MIPLPESAFVSQSDLEYGLKAIRGSIPNTASWGFYKDNRFISGVPKIFAFTARSGQFWHSRLEHYSSRVVKVQAIPSRKFGVKPASRRLWSYVFKR